MQLLTADTDMCYAATGIYMVGMERSLAEVLLAVARTRRQDLEINRVVQGCVRVSIPVVSKDVGVICAKRLILIGSCFVHKYPLNRWPYEAVRMWD